MAKLKHPKAKGTRLENEVVSEFKQVGYESERMWGSNGRSRGLPEEVDVLIHPKVGSYEVPLYIQCKSVAKLAEKFKPSDKIDAVVYKENRGEKYILLRLDDFIKRFL